MQNSEPRTNDGRQERAPNKLETSIKWRGQGRRCPEKQGETWKERQRGGGKVGGAGRAGDRRRRYATASWMGPGQLRENERSKREGLCGALSCSRENETKDMHQKGKCRNGCGAVPVVPVVPEAVCFQGPFGATLRAKPVGQKGSWAPNWDGLQPLQAVGLLQSAIPGAPWRFAR